MNIQWFPGHMTKARRLITAQVKLVDAVCEIVDARIPVSSRNPDLDSLTGGKPRFLILNRTDQADPAVTKKWAAYFRSQSYAVLETDSKNGKGTAGFSAAVRELLKDRLAAFEAKGQAGHVVRVMIVGIPNVGKSSFINRIAKRKAAEASDKPGVTRGKQWITIDAGLELLDTPGILWPRFDSQEVGENLAFTGAVKDDILDREALAANLALRLRDVSPGVLEERYKIIPEAEKTGFELLEEAAKNRGFLVKGGEADTERMAAVLLDEFRAGRLGRVTLESPPGSGE
ncbi:MAG: ribosome biogenesis GTPase YlqF [Clostridiales bacterium]|nr:ribosome biogenesis GTPase YlqF [Clostridiales bacterium]